jgi:hypothetical protein
MIALEEKHDDCSELEGNLRITLRILNNQLTGIKANEKLYIAKINTTNDLNKGL